jgi:phosphoesterase RecJ-like protein
MKTLDLASAAAELRGRDGFIIISHRRPDGDALGSSAALCRILRALGKTAYTLRNPQTIEKYLPFVDAYCAPEGYEAATVVTVDLADEGIIQFGAEEYVGKADIAIDHHLSNKGYCEKTLVMPHKASCGEVVLLLGKELGVTIDVETATLLYIALTTDSGCFRYKNTTAETLAAGAELVSYGIPNGDLTKLFFMTKRKSRLLIESEIIASLRFFNDDELVIAPLTLEMIRAAGADEEDMEDIAVIAGQVEGVETSITIRELEEGGCKVSVRTVKYANADAICVQYGGGGHGMAAGCQLDCGMEEAVELMRRAADKVWKQG